MERTCEGCTKCCEGWLTATIKGRPMFPGQPCHFVKKGTGCTTYASRPKEPCRTYQCLWLNNKDIPYYLRPADSNVILTSRTLDNIGYIELVPTGNKVEETVLSWYFTWAASNKRNITWTTSHGQLHYFGSDEFCSAMKRSLERRA